MYRKGFTLIELLVVVLIIGILAAIALPQYEKSVKESQTTEAMTALTAITNAQESYFLAHGSYTSDLNQLIVTVPEGKYYYYQCGRTCYARPKVKDLPVLEFHMQRATGDARSNYLGKRWCQVNDVSPSSAMALSICKSIGVEDTTMAANKYFMIY